MEKDVYRICSQIKETKKEVQKQTEDYLDDLAKPPGSLGELEHFAAKISSITGKVQNHLDKRAVLVFASDNGVIEEGVASGPQSLTASQTLNMLKGITGVAVLAKHFHSDLMVVDVGINADLDHPDLIKRKIRKSTSNIAKEEAMSEKEVFEALQIGIDLASEAKEKGYQVIGIGEMGIGNTTTSSAVLAAILNIPKENMEEIVGKGAGLTLEAYQKKVETVKKALEINQPDQKNIPMVLQKVGGFDLAAMTGAYLGAAYYQIPVVMDGFISVVAALCAVKMQPYVRQYLFPSHKSFERGYMIALKEMELSSCLDLNMRLGEGSGCPIMFEILAASCSIVREMATFEQAEINRDYLNKIKIPEAF
ncbi:MAG: nicotinate-nucleotide--dimethylbenzimidazole phosphoribosyltransferase [Acetivibrio sp.]